LWYASALFHCDPDLIRYVIAYPTTVSLNSAMRTRVRGVVMREWNLAGGREYGGCVAAMVDSQSLCSGSEEVEGSYAVMVAL